MITSLSFSIPEKDNLLKKILYKIKNDKVDVKIEQARGVHIKQVKYTSYSGKLKLEKVDKFIGAQKSKLVCNEKLKFPQNSGYKRFNSYDFSIRLCTNMALKIVSEMESPEKLRIGIYDTKAISADILPMLLKHCSNVIVVTDNEERYYEVTEQAMDELGATAVITKNINEIENCDLIIAPQVITEKLPLKREAVVLTIDSPKVEVPALVYHKYYFKMPNGFDRIKPIELDEEYFCSALYSLCSQFELGSIVPTVCRNYSTSQTVKSLSAYIKRFT